MFCSLDILLTTLKNIPGGLRGCVIIPHINPFDVSQWLTRRARGWGEVWELWPWQVWEEEEVVCSGD